MEVRKKYTIVIEGTLYTDGKNAETVERTINEVPIAIRDLINDNLPEGLVCVICKEED